MVKEIMNENIICYFSEKGHNNFFYPTDKKAVLKCNAPFESLAWISTNPSLRAVKVQNKYILPLTFEDDNINLKENKYSIVWIKKTITAP